MKRTRLFSLCLIFALFLAALPISAFANDSKVSALSEESFTPTAEVMSVYGGKKAIVSLTFDDSFYDSALVVEELCEKYDLKASMMMWCSRIGLSGSQFASAKTWSELFAKGYLEPQNHSMTHSDLRADTTNGSNNQDPEKFQSEIVDSKEYLEGLFPEYDFLTYAMPFGGMSAAAQAVAQQYYYALRGVSSSKVQSLDPGFGTANGTWGSLYSPSVVLGGSGDKHVELLQNQLDNYINKNGWYVPYIHQVGDVSGAEMSYYVIDKFFAYIAECEARGDVWVTTFSDATKYIRECQNVTSSIRYDGECIYVKLDMAEMTEDNLPLSEDVFNHPLTVKVKVPATFEEVCYNASGSRVSSNVFTENGETYVYVDVVPNTGEVEVSASHQYSKFTKIDSSKHFANCDCGELKILPHTTNAYGYCEDCEVGFSKASISIGSTVSLNYYVNINSSFILRNTEISMLFNHNGEQKTVTEYKELDNGLYVFSFDGIELINAAVDVNAELMIDGEPFADKSGFSAQSYCQTALKLFAEDDELVTLINDFLIYAGALEKAVKGTQTIGSNMTLSPSAAAPDETDNAKRVSGNENEKLFIDSASLIFNKNTRIAFKIYSELSDFTVSITSAGSPLAVIYSKEELEDNGSGYYTANSRIISPEDFSGEICAKVTDENGNTVSEYIYTVNTYAYELAGSSSAEADAKALALALYRYGKSAVNYINK